MNGSKAVKWNFDALGKSTRVLPSYTPHPHKLGFIFIVKIRYKK